MATDDLREMLTGWLKRRPGDWWTAMNLRNYAYNSGAMAWDDLPSLRQIATALAPEVRSGRVAKHRRSRPATQDSAGYSMTFYRWIGGGDATS